MHSEQAHLPPCPSPPTEPLFVSPGFVGLRLVTTEDNVIKAKIVGKNRLLVGIFFIMFLPPGPAEDIRGSGTEG